MRNKLSNIENSWVYVYRDDKVIFIYKFLNAINDIYTQMKMFSTLQCVYLWYIKNSRMLGLYSLFS